MRIVYLCNAQIPSRSTNALQVMRMCAGFHRAGADVTLLHARRIGNRPEGFDGNVWDFYGIPERFRIIGLPTPLTRSASRSRFVARPLEAAPFAAYLSQRARPSATPFVAYARSLLGTWLLLQIRRRFGARSACRGIVLELHDEPRRNRDWSVVAAVDAIVVISNALRDRLIKRLPELAERIWVERDGVDLRLFDGRRLDRADARETLGLAHEPVAVYTGRVNAEKGARILVDAAAELSRWRILLVGRVYDSGFYEDTPANIILAGYVPPANVPLYVAAADAVVLPSTDALPYAAFTSPLKLFEYMASGRPIVAADLPVLREVLTSGRNALLYPPRDANALAEQLERLRTDTELANELGRVASEDVRQYEWTSRASRLLGRMETFQSDT